MKRIILLAIIGCLTLGGWAMAQQQEMLKNTADVQMQKMDDASCDPSSDPSGGG